MTDIEIAQSAELIDIRKIAEKLGLSEDDLELYGKYKAKISEDYLNSIKNNPDGKLVLVTAINPTPLGEGKTTTTVGLGQALGRRGIKSMIALREPSVGPVFGIKGGAAGGGYSQVIPMEDINLHFTGDFHAISAANNLLAAMLDNHIHQGNALNINPKDITWKRCVDMNDRALRDVIIGLGSSANGVAREDHFIITVASEIMAILCLASDIEDLRARLSRIIVGYNYEGKPVTAGDLKAVGAMTALLKDAIRPNLVQTLEHTPVLIHGGPFANIAHGCNSLIATKAALKMADVVVTEAGFGADLGAEKFLDIKCRMGGLTPSAVVIVATVRALKYNGGVAKDNLLVKDVDALARGIVNLEKHIENMQNFGLPVVVSLNHFVKDDEEEIAYIKDFCEKKNCRFVISDVWAKGGEGALDLVDELLDIFDKTGTSSFRQIYDLDLKLEEKINVIAKEIYGADGVEFTADAKKKLARISSLGFDNLPVCVAKTQYSLSDDPKLLGRPKNFKITVSDAYVSAGAGFVVMLTGSILTMPGLPKVPAAENIDVNEDGKIVGLF